MDDLLTIVLLLWAFALIIFKYPSAKIENRQEEPEFMNEDAYKIYPMRPTGFLIREQGKYKYPSFSPHFAPIPPYPPGMPTTEEIMKSEIKKYNLDWDS